MLSISDILFAFKVVICITVLLYACRSDIRTMTVPNKFWGIALLAIATITIVEIIIDPAHLFYIFTALASVAIFYLAFKAGVFGGADAKALMLLAIAFPCGAGWISLVTFANAALIATCVLVVAYIFKFKQFKNAYKSVFAFIPFITAGFIIALVYGCLMWRCMDAIV